MGLRYAGSKLWSITMMVQARPERPEIVIRRLDVKMISYGNIVNLDSERQLTTVHVGPELKV